jgi:DNA-binding transcriptional LysR family regulator
MPMDLKQLRVLRAIADTGSFHGAAAKLHLTQPAISHQLKSLESELAEALVIRSRPRVALSSAGVVVLAAAKRIEAELEGILHHFAPQKPESLTGVLRIAASTLGIVYLYGDIFERFIARYPRIEVVVTAAESGIGAARHVIEGTSDVAFTPFPIDLPDLEATLLADTEHVVIVSRSHGLAMKRLVSVADLQAHPFIRYQSDAGSRAMSDQVFLANGGYPPIFLESNDTEFIKRVVRLGLGAAIVPAFTVTKEGRDRRLATLRVDGMPIRQGFGLVCRKDIRMRTLTLFRDFCLAHRPGIGSPDRVPPGARAPRREPADRKSARPKAPGATSGRRR